MVDITPPDYLSETGKVRALILDTEQWDYDGSGTLRYRLSDEQIGAFLSISGEGRLFAAGAMALRALATNEALISKVIRTEDLQTDGAKLATELRLMGRELDRQQTDSDNTLAMETAFMIVDTSYPYSPAEW